MSGAKKRSVRATAKSPAGLPPGPAGTADPPFRPKEVSTEEICPLVAYTVRILRGFKLEDEIYKKFSYDEFETMCHIVGTYSGLLRPTEEFR